MKTSELKGAQLNYAVALAMGCTFKESSIGAIHAFKDGRFIGGFVGKTERGVAMPDRGFYPSTSWENGGTIIDRERIGILPMNTKVTGDDHGWAAVAYGAADDDGLSDDEFPHSGPTPLIAAMRAYVASVLGEDVDIDARVAA